MGSMFMLGQMSSDKLITNKDINKKGMTYLDQLVARHVYVFFLAAVDDTP